MGVFLVESRIEFFLSRTEIVWILFFRNFKACLISFFIKSRFKNGFKISLSIIRSNTFFDTYSRNTSFFESWFFPSIYNMLNCRFWIIRKFSSSHFLKYYFLNYSSSFSYFFRKNKIYDVFCIVYKIYALFC